MQKISNKKEKNQIINASEISQYHYCSISWYLQKMGYKPKSEEINIGRIKHEKLGYIMDKTKIYRRNSLLLRVISYSMLFIAILIIYFEVI